MFISSGQPGGLVLPSLSETVGLSNVGQRFNRKRLDPDAGGWRDRVNRLGGTVDPYTLRLVSNLCKSAKRFGLWHRIRRWNLMCGDFIALFVPLKVEVSGQATDTNRSSLFTVDDYFETGLTTGGLKGDGTMAMMTGFNPLVKSSLTDFHLSAYTRGVEAGGTSRILMGCSTSSSVDWTCLAWLATGAREVGEIAQASPTTYSPTSGVAAKQGHLLVTTNFDREQQYYTNGVRSVSQLVATGAFANTNIAIFNDNRFTAGQFTLDRYVMGYSIGYGLSASEAHVFSRIWRDFNIRMARAV